MPLEPALKARIATVRMALLDLHKLLLDRERALYERTNPPIQSPGEFLSLVIEHQQFAWLRKLSGMIVEMDELLSIRTKSGNGEAEAVIANTRAMLRLHEDGDDFQSRYYAAIQDSPDIVIAHCKVEKLVRSASEPNTGPAADSF